MSFDLYQRVCVLTGATGLLGRHHADALAEAGASVVCVDLVEEQAKDLAATLETIHGTECVGVAADVTDPPQLESLRERILATLGRIDVLVNNAAIDDKIEQPNVSLEDSRFERYPLELFRRTLEVNVTGTFLACQILGAPMLENGGGSIINIASTYGVVAPNQSLYRRPDGSQTFFKPPAYPTSKGAILALTRYLAAYWGSANVRVNALSPGGVENAQEDWFVEAYSARTLLGRMAHPYDFGGALVFLASDASRYMTGANLVVDGGFTTC